MEGLCAAKQSPVQARITAVREKLDILTAVIQDLNQKLDPVLSQEPEPEPGTKLDPALSVSLPSKLCGEIADIEDLIEQSTQMLGNTIRQLTL